MRITNKQITENFVADVNRNRVEFAKLNKQISTLKRVNQPSDDPAAYSLSRVQEARVRRNTQYQENVQAGIEQARVASEQINFIQDQMVTLKKLATQGANVDTLDQGALDIISENVAGIRETLVQLGNSEYNDRYIFSGTATNVPALTRNGNTVTYNGNGEDLSIPISENNTTRVSASGERIFDIGGADDVFEMLTRLQTALENADGDAVRAEFEKIDNATNRIGSISGDLGNAVIRMEFAFNEYETSSINLQSNISRMVDTDLAEAISRFQNLETSYTAALSAGSRILQLSLVNFI